MGIPRPALLIAAHGSRADGWSTAVEDFARDVHASPGVADAFSVVQACFLEHSVPPIPAAVRMVLSSGCPEAVVVPLFLTASTHVTEDLPAILGLEGPEHVRRRLTAEGKMPLVGGLPVRLVSLGPVEDLLLDNIRRRTSLASKDPSHEAVVLCAYGSTIHHARWESLLHVLRTRLMRAGFAYACHAYVGPVAGLSPQPTAEAILDASRMAGVRRVFVVPLLVARGNLQDQLIASAVRDAERRGRTPIAYHGDAILPDGDLAARVGFRALEALGVFPSIGKGAVDA